MKSITILVPETAVLEAIADPRYLFTAANDFLMASGQEALFDVKLVGVKRDVVLMNGLVTIHCEQTIDEVEKTDLIIIPALSGNMKDALEKNKSFLPWLRKQYAAGAELASLCVGAFMLADTGLLNGRKCSTHWLSADEFRAMFPQVDLVDGSIISEESNIYSSGGANSYWNLLLYLLEKYSSRQMAIMASKFFAIDMDRTDQNKFMIFRGQRNHQDELVKRVQDIIENQHHEKFTVDHLAGIVAIGRRSLERRFRSATKNTVLEYMQRVRIEAAKRKLEETSKTVSEVMFESGYSDVKAFRDLFRKITGLSPIEYRNKFNKVLAGKAEAN